MLSSVDITIIVPTCNRPMILRQCLDSIKSQTLEPSKVIVMDQSDDEECIKVCRSYDVVYHHCEYKNKSKAINDAILMSDTSWLSIVDDDTVLASNWIEIVIQKRAKYPNVQIIQGSIYSSSGYDDANADIHTKEEIVNERVITPLFLIGCNFAFSKSLYDRVGPFNEQLGPGTPNKGGEDIEWGHRVLYDKNPLLICPDLKLIHQAWRTQKDVISQMSNYGIAMAAVLKILKSRCYIDFIFYYIKVLFWLDLEIVGAIILRRKQIVDSHRAYRNNFKTSYKNS